MTVELNGLTAVITLSTVADRASRHRRPAPLGWLAICLMMSSLMPTSASFPATAPLAAPMASAASGLRKSSPMRVPHRAPEAAPAPVRLIAWWMRTLPLSSR
jgi:hypothetical protein